MGLTALPNKPKPAKHGVVPVRKKLPTNIAAAAAKTNLLLMLASVHEAGEYVITKRGKPIAKLVPFDEKPLPDIYGCMKGTVEIVGDIMAPLPPEEWGDLY
ncbi:type II toxin-antitoxin system Phd/YefM family antitoxin [Terriglobus sp.]|uniref:type II toxin-antitoxin system Phd/YefM family antitoxin n=1 Tax=Terriglobus sp. TaxID=1889013 RepID=UPI003B00E28B